MSIKEKFIKGAFWNTLSQGGAQILNFVFTIVLAHYLTPGDFGMVGQVTVIIGFLSFLCEFGFSPSLIQKKEIDDIDTSTVFWGMVFMSSVLYVLCFFASPLIARFYNNDSLILMSRILFLQFLLIPLYIINEILEEKKLHYRNIVQSEIVSFVLSIGIGIGMVIAGYGVWGLVVQMLLKFIFKIILLLYWTEWRPKMLFSFSRFKGFFKSGMKYTYQNLNVYLNSNMDFLLVGKFAGAWMLGIYTLAFRISNYPVMKMYQIIGRMLFPAFNLIKHDLNSISENYLKLVRFGGFVLVPFVISIFFGIESFIIIFLGEAWLDAGIIAKILAIYLLFLSFSFADEPLLMTLGRINFINILRTMVTLLLLGFGFLGIKYYGIKGMASVFTIVWFFSILCMKIVLLNELKITMTQYFLKIRSIIIAGGLYSAILVLYTFLITWFTELPYAYLLGEGIIFILFMIVVLVKTGVVNISQRKINLDMI